MPIGNLNFKVVNEFNRLPNSLRVSTSWQMTLQLSEV
jgi:hypothetical protein